MITTPAVAHSPKLAFALSFAVVLFLGLLIGAPAPEGGAGPGPTPPPLELQQIEWDGAKGTLQHVTATTRVAPSSNADVNIRPSESDDLVQVCVRPHGRLGVVGGGWERQEHGNLTWCIDVPEDTEVQFELGWRQK
jgi:hypothetical protein